MPLSLIFIILPSKHVHLMFKTSFFRKSWKLRCQKMVGHLLNWGVRWICHGARFPQPVRYPQLAKPRFSHCFRAVLMGLLFPGLLILVNFGRKNYLLYAI